MQWRMRSRYAQSKEERRSDRRLIRPDMKLYNVSHLCCIHSFVLLSFIKHCIHYTTVPPIPAILIGYGPLFSQNFLTVIQRKSHLTNATSTAINAATQLATHSPQ
jgi:hypothetical protein